MKLDELAMIDQLFLIDLDARVAVYDAVVEASRIFELERRLTAAERETIIAEKFAAARHDLDCYQTSDADQAWRRAIDAVMGEIRSSSIERAAAKDRPDYVALSPAEAAAILLERRRA
jgi:hypothetical protein